MRAWQVDRLASPAHVTLRLVRRPQPTLAEGQLRVRVRAAAANFPDVLMCRGLYQVKPDLPFTPGVELCGEVVEVGPARGGRRATASSAAPSCRTAPSPTRPSSTPPPSPRARGARRRAGRQLLHRLPDRLVRPAPPRPPAARRDPARPRRRGRGRQRRRPARQGRRRPRHRRRRRPGQGAGRPRPRRRRRRRPAQRGLRRGRQARDRRPRGRRRLRPGRRRDLRPLDQVHRLRGRILVIGFAGGTIQTPPLGHALVKNYSVVGLHWGLYAKVMPQLIGSATPS